MSKSTIQPEILKHYDELISSFPDIERKGKTTPYTSANGYMFSFLTKEGFLGLRLSKAGREKFLTEYKTNLMKQHGRVMKEFVVVPGQIFKDKKRIKDYLAKSFEYVLTLKPK